MKLRLWRVASNQQPIILDDTPTGAEEEENLFGEPIDDPRDLNTIISAQSRLQDMDERKIFADRSFLLALIWVIFLVIMPFFQMLVSKWGYGLSDNQFIAVVTTTTASVFGFWYLVGRYLFPNNNAKPEDDAANTPPNSG